MASSKPYGIWDCSCFRLRTTTARKKQCRMSDRETAYIRHERRHRHGEHPGPFPTLCRHPWPGHRTQHPPSIGTHQRTKEIDMTTAFRTTTTKRARMDSTRKIALIAGVLFI